MSSAFEAETKRSAGRPRCSETHKEILEAAADLLEREHYRNISVDRIAAEAKVGKQTIYRWWETKADLVLEAYLCRIMTRYPFEKPTGDALRDIRTDLRRVIDSMNRPACATAIRGLFAEAQLDEGFRARFTEVFIAALYSSARPYLLAGIESGQLRADLNVDLAINLIYGSISMRFLSGSLRLELSAADELIDFLTPVLVATGARPIMVPPLDAMLMPSEEVPAWVY